MKTDLQALAVNLSVSRDRPPTYPSPCGAENRRLTMATLFSKNKCRSFGTADLAHVQSAVAEPWAHPSCAWHPLDRHQAVPLHAVRLIQKGNYGRALKHVLADKNQMQRRGLLTQWEAAEFSPPQIMQHLTVDPAHLHGGDCAAQTPAPPTPNDDENMESALAPAFPSACAVTPQIGVARTRPGPG